MTVFRDESDYEFYEAILSDLVNDLEISFHHYCLMPNHVHFMVGHASNNVSLFMQRLQQSYSRYFRRKYDYAGHVWQKRFFSNPITKDNYLLVCGSYIELNPVRAKLVARPEDWRHSSYRHYGLGEAQTIIQDNPLFSDSRTFISDFRRNYRTITEETAAAKNIPSALVHK